MIVYHEELLPASLTIVNLRRMSIEQPRKIDLKACERPTEKIKGVLMLLQ